ncbi:MAG: hypothetical protein COA93_00485 [Alphaproteobacteria bacterium]|nr:MAG: hypothetical protein COA93_00485 [Alphaproteobacteria bacterium]
MAFLDEYNLDIQIPDISELSDHDFIQSFQQFKSRVQYIILRFSLRKNRITGGTAGTLISIKFTYKGEIGNLLETIRKIVNQEVKETKKRDKIFSKIASLQSEIDRDQTTIDAIFGHMIDLSETVGECAERLEPVIDKLERIKKLLWDNSKKVEALPTPGRPKLITKEKDNSGLDDEIPF